MGALRSPAAAGTRPFLPVADQCGASCATLRHRMPGLAVRCANGRAAARMGWASGAVERLRRGEVATVRPRGRSMAGKIEDGDLVTVEPLGARALHVGDVVLVRVRGREYLHLIKAIQGDRYLIGNNRGGVNGWLGRQAVASGATEIAPARR